MTHTLVGQTKYTTGLDLALGLPASNICPEYKGDFESSAGLQSKLLASHRGQEGR